MVPEHVPSFGDELHVLVPPYSTYLRTVRLLAADAAARAGLDCEEAEDFRLAVDELCQAAIRSTDHAILVSMECSEGRVIARGTARARDGYIMELSDLSATIVDALSDHYEFELKGSDLTFAVRRRRAIVHR
jgi:hypothetical protein